MKLEVLLKNHLEGDFMKDILIVGAGGLGRETEWLIERINDSKKDKEWNILGYVDDNIPKGTDVRHSKVVYSVDDLLNIDKKTYVVIAIANVYIRKSIYDKLKVNNNLEFPNLIDPTVIIGDVELGIGNIICANSLLTINIKISNFDIICANSIITHDDEFDDFVTLYPSVNISGHVKIEKFVEIGTGSKVIQELIIKNDVIIGAGSVVIRDIEDKGTYVGVPIKKVK